MKAFLLFPHVNQEILPKSIKYIEHGFDEFVIVGNVKNHFVYSLHGRTLFLAWNLDNVRKPDKYSKYRTLTMVKS